MQAKSDSHAELVIRQATNVDEHAISRLAALDSKGPLAGPVLMAEIAGRLWAALAVRTNDSIADPFEPSGPLVELLRLRARAIA